MGARRGWAAVWIPSVAHGQHEWGPRGVSGPPRGPTGEQQAGVVSLIGTRHAGRFRGSGARQPLLEKSQAFRSGP